MKVATQFEWISIGVVAVEEGMLRFPVAPEEPGIYQFDFGQSVYIGETDRLRRRFQHYRTPGPSQHTNIRLRARILAHIDGGGTVMVSIATHATVIVDSTESNLDFSRKASRLMVESAALTSAHLLGIPVENL
jgi:hypothetical protein